MKSVRLYEKEAAFRHGQNMFEQPAAERMEVARGGGQPLQGLGVTVQQEQHKPAQRLVDDMLFRKGAQLGEHGIAVEAGAFDEVRELEPVRAIGVADRADVRQLDLRAVDV